MKKIALTICGIALAALVVAQQLAFNEKATFALPEEKAAFNWSITSYDFGSIKQGVPVSHEFTFTNTGGVPLVITSVQASCGCTVTSYTNTAIAPGDHGFVKATYNAARSGRFSKTVSVMANTEEPVAVLTIQGEVKE
jgi:hypothetical protein